MIERRSFTNTRAPDLTRGTDWRERVACLDDWDLFGRTVDWPRDTNATNDALAICSACPVRTPCLAAGLDIEHGIVGGTTPEQRQETRRKDPA
jgi:WhiB family redox-sensing transcriptional regulator